MDGLFSDTKTVEGAADAYVDGVRECGLWDSTIVVERDRINLQVKTLAGSHPVDVRDVLCGGSLVEVYVGLLGRTTDPDERTRMLGWLRERAATLSNNALVSVGRTAPEWLQDEDLVRISQDPNPEIRAFLTEAIAQRGRGAKMSDEPKVSGGVRR